MPSWTARSEAEGRQPRTRNVPRARLGASCSQGCCAVATPQAAALIIPPGCAAHWLYKYDAGRREVAEGIWEREAAQTAKSVVSGWRIINDYSTSSGWMAQQREREGGWRRQLAASASLCLLLLLYHAKLHFKNRLRRPVLPVSAPIRRPFTVPSA